MNDMRRLLVGVAVVAATLAVATPAPAATIGVSIFGKSFSPDTITLNSNDSITWTNKDKTDHQVVANDGSFASPILSPGKTFSFTFKRGGTFRYHDAFRAATAGKITVKGPPPSLAFALSQPIVVAGTQVTLSGKVSSGKANESVEITAQQYGQPSPVQLAIVKTGSDGTFAYMTTPEMYTTYVAQWGNITSGQLLEQVQPKVQLLAGGNGYFRAQVAAARSFAGKHVMLQRLSGLGQWVNVASLTLGSQGGKIFRPRSYLPKGVSQIRVFLSVNQAGIGLLSNFSGTQTVRR
jgi:plastocyanin